MSHAAEPQSSQSLPIADPTPIGLICLAIGCAALAPIAFGAGLTPAGPEDGRHVLPAVRRRAANSSPGWASLLNKNVYGGTLFTSFAFNWVINWWALDSLSRGHVPDATIVFAVDVCFLVVFLAFTYGFGFFSCAADGVPRWISTCSTSRASPTSGRRRVAGRRRRHLHGRAWRDLALDRVCAAHQPGGGPRGVRVPWSRVPPSKARMIPAAVPSPTAALEALALPQVDHVDLVTVRLPFVAPFGTSIHVWTVKDAMLMRVEAGGVTAWSECVSDPDPFYSYETNTTARHIINDFLLPLVEPGITIGEFEGRFGRVRGHGMAKATIENALLILIANQRGVPLHELLDRPAKKIMSGLSIGLKEHEGGSREGGRARGREGLPPRQDEGEEGPGRRLGGAPCATASRTCRSWSTRTATTRSADADHLRQLDAFDLTMVEQPLSYSDIIEHASLQREMRTALCLDESIHSLADAAAAISIGACRIINVKQGRVGGLLESMRIAHHAAGLGIGVWSGGMDETGIGRAVNIHLQTAEGFTLPGDTSETASYFDEDIVDRPSSSMTRASSESRRGPASAPASCRSGS